MTPTRLSRCLLPVGLAAATGLTSGMAVDADAAIITLTPAVDGTSKVDELADPDAGWDLTGLSFNSSLLRIGNINAGGSDDLRRGLVKFDAVTLPAAEQLGSATLRLYLDARTNSATQFNIDVFHSVGDNAVTGGQAFTFDDPGYVDTAADLIAAGSVDSNRYYEVDVTAQVAADLSAADGVSAFRLQLADDLAISSADTVFPNFLFNDSGDTFVPQLVLETVAIPEPSAAGLLGLGLLGLVQRRRRQA